MKQKADIPPTNPRRSFTTAEVAAQLGISKRSVYRLRDRGLLNPSRGLRTLIFTDEELKRYLTSTMNMIK